MQTPAKTSGPKILTGTAAVACATMLLSGCTAPANDELSSEIQAVIDDPMFTGGGWGIYAVDLETGDPVYELNSTIPFVPGSIQKSFTTAAVLEILGGEERLTTPVYGTGEIVDGTLDGDLVLVGSGDFSFGLRDLPDDSLEITSFDHNEANTGLLPVELNSGDPLSALRSLAGSILESGVSSITGDVVVENQLFDPMLDWPDGRIDSIWVNENVVDVELTANEVGERPDIRVIPHLDALSVVNDVTVVAGDAVEVAISMNDMTVTASGTIGIDAGVTVRNTQVPDPVAFAATAFRQVLDEEGIVVNGSGLESKIPFDEAASEPLAEWVSPPLSEFARVVQKISYNRGADLLACLIAVSEESTDCVDGAATVLTAVDARNGENAVRLFDPAGSVDENRSSAQAHVDFLRSVHDEPWGDQFVDLQPIAGVDGSLVSLGVGTSAEGNIHAKTGTRIHWYPTTKQLFYLARSYSGYVTTESGRDLAFTVIFNSTTVDDIDGVFEINDRIADIILALQKKG
ncbi:D-alanyl-D-alanine carboxypeptidase/D-alanyl-D-alanine-endopeptidase [uncultured Salinibacterium sp.]|uniref:D-alanyl-D-alanine carboxypeptidase/D-alanyl-D-alanine endopeptidase n=1 Tax=uncultured Salinibacterium sp. TaxID=459274 RepID=UPI0030DB770F